MLVQTDISLQQFNTFGIDVCARAFCEVRTVEDVHSALNADYAQKYILGGGSNVLFTKDFDGLIIKIALKGIEILDESAEKIGIKVASGEHWHDLVMHCVRHGWGGIENLALIPGTVGAAPVQNIGAYGVEIKDVLTEVEGIHRETGETLKFTAEECRFGYRDSIFKRDLREKFVITSVSLNVVKNSVPNITYAALSEELVRKNIEFPTIADVAEAVCAVRRSKLPDPAFLGNAGSFFKNPEISAEKYKEVQAKFGEIPSFAGSGGNIKIPAGWLIEKCGWKGKKIGNVGVHEKQALVLVNYGGGLGTELVELARKIQDSVAETFGIMLEPEVHLL